MRNVTWRRVRITIVAVEKQQYAITYSECVTVTLIIYHAKRMRRIIYCHLWNMWIFQIFTHYLVNGTNFEKKMLQDM